MELNIILVLLLTLSWIECQSLRTRAPPSVQFPGMSFEYAFSRPMLTAGNVYQSESSEFPILSSFKDWIPRPWVKILKEAGFRRRSPAAHHRYRPMPQPMPRPAKYTPARKTIASLPPTYPSIAKKAMVRQQPCTCDTRTRYAARTAVVETPIMHKTPPVKGSWTASSMEPAIKGQPSHKNQEDDKNEDYDEEYEDDGDDKYEEDMEWTDAELEFMCRRLADSKQKKEAEIVDWSIRQSSAQHSIAKSTSANRHEDKGKTRIQA